MTIATADIRTGPPRRMASSHRPEHRRPRAWCVHCGVYRDLVLIPGANPIFGLHSAQARPTGMSPFVACTGSGVELQPDPVALAHWSLHRDACRTAAGLVCVCPLGVES